MTTTTPTCLDTDQLTIAELYTALRPELEALDESLDYLSISVELRYKPAGDTGVRMNQPIGPYRWIACYPVTGGSEGHYIHVDRLYQAEPYAREYSREPLFLIKTFGGWERACEIAAYLGARLGA